MESFLAFLRKNFEEWFLSVDRELKQSIRLKIEEDAIIQHIVRKEKRDAKPEPGVKDVALAFALYKRWRKFLLKSNAVN